MAFEIFAKEFAELGGRHILGVPGGGQSLELINAVESHGGEFVGTGHEAVAALMAGACARHTNSPAVCVSIKGPGFINLVPGLLCNSYEGFPSLSISEAYSPQDTGGRRHKWLNHAAVISEFARGVGAFNEEPEYLTRCWRRASAEFPGPVHLELAAGHPPISEIASMPDSRASSAIDWRAQIKAAKCPALIVGSLASRAKWRGQLTRLQLPVFTTAAAKGTLTENSAAAAGVFTGDGKPPTPERQLLPKADLVIAIGVRSGEILTPPPAKVLWLESAGVVPRSIFPENAPGQNAIVLTDVEILELFELCRTKNWGLDELARAKASLISATAGWDASPRRMMELVQTKIPKAAHVVDTGNFTIWAEHFLVAQRPEDFTGTPNGRFMGAGIGYALGVGIARAPAPVVLWIGDGGLRAYFGELSLAARRKLPLLVLVLKDGYYGSVRGRARKVGWPESALQLPEQGWLTAAEAFDFFTARAATLDQLDVAIEGWKQSGQSGLIEFQVPPEKYVETTELLR